MRVHVLDVSDLSVDSFSTAAISAAGTTTRPMTDTGSDTSPGGSCSGVICTYTCPLTTGGGTN